MSTSNYQDYRETSVVTSKQYFVDKCLLSLLSNTTLSDFVIADNEFVNFLRDVCITSGKCSPNDYFTFSSLDVFVQIEFIWLLCPNQGDACLDFYLDQHILGFDVSSLEEKEKQERVQNLCHRVWKVATKYHGGTNAPIVNPTSKPVLDQTSIPSSNPYSISPFSNSSQESILAESEVEHTPGIDISFVVIGLILFAVIAFALSVFIVRRKLKRNSYERENKSCMNDLFLDIELYTGKGLGHAPYLLNKSITDDISWSIDSSSSVNSIDLTLMPGSENEIVNDKSKVVDKRINSQIKSVYGDDCSSNINDSHHKDRRSIFRRTPTTVKENISDTDYLVPSTLDLKIEKTMTYKKSTVSISNHGESAAVTSGEYNKESLIDSNSDTNSNSIFQNVHQSNENDALETASQSSSMPSMLSLFSPSIEYMTGSIKSVDSSRTISKDSISSSSPPKCYEEDTLTPFLETLIDSDDWVGIDRTDTISFSSEDTSDSEQEFFF